MKINKRLWEIRRFRVTELTEEDVHEMFGSDNEYKDYDNFGMLQIFPKVDTFDDLEEFYSAGYSRKEVLKLLKDQFRKSRLPSHKGGVAGSYGDDKRKKKV